MLKKTMVAVGAAATLGLAMTAAPQPAHAVWWVAPAIIGGVVGGAVIGAAATNNAYAYYTGPGDVYVAPTASCRWVQVQRNGRIFRERICG
jgi:hypothetical protein